MQNDTNLQFIREKIFELQNAVMYESSGELVKLRNDIVTALEVDDKGQLWYVTNRPSHRVEECEQNFPARLIFYKKGVDYFIEVSGKATIVNKNYFPNESRNDKKILMKLNMVNIKYTEPHAKRSKNKIEMLLENWYTWFLHSVSVPHHLGSAFKKLWRTN